MPRHHLPAIAAATVFVAFAAMQRLESADAAFVDLDVVVLDDDQRPIRGLNEQDFEIREDGKTVPILTAEEVAPPSPRTMVLVLDDISVVGGTIGMQNIGYAFLSGADAQDRVSVLRLSHHGDEAAGDLKAAVGRIDSYVAGSYPFAGRETVQNWLRLVTKVSRQLEGVDGRKSIVSIGSPELLDIAEPLDRDKSLIWEDWVDAVNAAARSSVAVYVVDPSGISARRRVSADGLVDKTGGQHFASNDIRRISSVIWEETGHYYLVSYVPSGASRQLHSIDVRVKRRGAHARARRSRGE